MTLQLQENHRDRRERGPEHLGEQLFGPDIGLSAPNAGDIALLRSSVPSKQGKHTYVGGLQGADYPDKQERLVDLRIISQRARNHPSYYAQWRARQPWRDSSRSSIESMFANHVLPAFSTRPLSSLRRGDVEAWSVQLPLAGTTARLAVQYLGAMLESAVDDGLIARNPVRGAKRPRVEPGPVMPYTTAELDGLWAHAPAWFRIALVLGTMAGLRQGELTGLTRDRIDFPRRTLKVDRQLVTPTAGDPSFGPPKTRTSYRTIPLADVAVENIASHIKQFGTGLQGLVLHENGEAVRRQRFGHLWRKLRASAGLPASAKFHNTRHTFASTLLSGGVGVLAAAEYLGHTPAVLLRTYAHLMPEDHDRARSVVQAAFGRRAEDSLRTAAPLASD